MANGGPMIEEATGDMTSLLGLSMRNFVVGEGEQQPNDATRVMNAEGGMNAHWLLPWSIQRTIAIMALLGELMTRGQELQWQTYQPTPVKERSMVVSVTMRIPMH